ncbi:hypothetical protein J3A83DRAFT_4076071, partial [Scleroderma citrinum]
SAGDIYLGADSIACALTASLIKQVIWKHRQIYWRKVSYGLPCTHCSRCTLILAVFVTLASLYLSAHPHLHPTATYTPLVMVSLTTLITLSPVWLGFHTWLQIATGSAFGVGFGCVWFKLW